MMLVSRVGQPRPYRRAYCDPSLTSPHFSVPPLDEAKLEINSLSNYVLSGR